MNNDNDDNEEAIEDQIVDIPELVDSSDESDSDNNILVPNGHHDADNTENDDSDDDEFEEIRFQPRMLLDGIGALLGQIQRVDDTSSGEEEAEGVNEGETENFDSELPCRHTYLGEGREVCGRTILDNDEIISDLPLLNQPGLSLVPGQLLPLNLIHPSVVDMMKNIIENTPKIFGVVNFKSNAQSWERAIGTTAEIFEYRAASDENVEEIGFKIKARGRQRFKLLSTRRQADGNLLGEVKMLEDRDLGEPSDLVKMKCQKPSSNVTSSCSSFRNTKSYGLARSSHPPWIFTMYSPSCLVSRVKSELKQFSSLSIPISSLSDNPAELSWWVAANIPLEDKLRAQILSINNPVQRLRLELSFLSMCQRMLICRRCKEHLGDQQNIFSMSKEGPQGAFVNPNGHVHETLTLYKAKNLRLIGQPSTVYSWFPGYAWTITECLGCSSHIGWKFTSTNSKLRPQKFYGITRTSIEVKIEVPETATENEIKEGIFTRYVM